jgi:hypothetical protein
VAESLLPAVDCNVHGINDVGETEIRTAGPLVLAPSSLRLKLPLKVGKTKIAGH